MLCLRRLLHLAGRLGERVAWKVVHVLVHGNCGISRVVGENCLAVHLNT